VGEAEKGGCKSGFWRDCGWKKENEGRRKERKEAVKIGS
jgi:hypothetical protein